MDKPAKINAVFEGGGVKGTGLVGAIAATEAAGFSFGNVAGTSAGAIVAALLSADYSAIELRKILNAVDYNRFKDATDVTRLPLIGGAISLFATKGIYAGDYLENWMRQLLLERNIRTFGDLVLPEFKNNRRFRYRLQVTASDISRGKLLFLPNDAADYGIDPDTLDVARAVRMSMSLPYFYRPVALQDARGVTSYVVDGGILSNFPVWILDNKTNPSAWPTFGYKLVEPVEGRPHVVTNPLNFLEAMFATMMEAHDSRYIKDADFMRTIPIPTLGVQTTDFGISQAQKDALFKSGETAAQNFFAVWNFKRYQKNMKAMADMSRSKIIETMRF
jgi:NTE family protein